MTIIDKKSPYSYTFWLVSMLIDGAAMALPILGNIANMTNNDNIIPEILISISYYYEY